MEYIDEITKKVAGEIADFEKKHGYINCGFVTGLARKYAIEAYNQAIRDAVESAEIKLQGQHKINGGVWWERNGISISKQSILKLLK